MSVDPGMNPVLKTVCSAFEVWCDEQRIHPETPGALDYYANLGEGIVPTPATE